MPAAIEGGTQAQQRVLREILDGLGRTSIELIRLEEWADDFAEHPSLGLVPTQEEIDATRGTSVRLVEPDPPELRAMWETDLVARAFEHRSRLEGLGRVVRVQWASEGGSAVGRRPPPPPLDSRSLERLRGDISRAAADANADLVSLDVLLAHGHAWAALLHVDEPHSFCRRGFRRFFEAVEHWSKLCAGQFLEVRDASERSVLATANGWSSLRQDLACCDPLFIYGRTLDSPPRPRCPVFRD